MTATKLKTIEKNEEDPVVTQSVLMSVLDQRFVEFEVKIDKKFEVQRKTYERYMGALAEEFNHRMDVIAEGISMLLEQRSKDSDENAKEHEIFRIKIARLEAKAI